MYIVHEIKGTIRISSDVTEPNIVGNIEIEAYDFLCFDAM